MITTVIMALGLVLILEGLVFALAPSRLEDVLDLLRRMPIGTRRLIGLLAAVIGLAILRAVSLL